MKKKVFVKYKTKKKGGQRYLKNQGFNPYFKHRRDRDGRLWQVSKLSDYKARMPDDNLPAEEQPVAGMKLHYKKKFKDIYEDEMIPYFDIPIDIKIRQRDAIRRSRQGKLEDEKT